MIDAESNRKQIQFWIGVLAFSMLLLATTFALMASYLGDIKRNTSEALIRSDMLNLKLHMLDSELAVLHRHMVDRTMNAEPSVALRNAATAQPAIPMPAIDQTNAALPLVRDITPPELDNAAPVHDKLPVLQMPVLAEPAPAFPAKP